MSYTFAGYDDARDIMATKRLQWYMYMYLCGIIRIDALGFAYKMLHFFSMLYSKVYYLV